MTTIRVIECVVLVHTRSPSLAFDESLCVAS